MRRPLAIATQAITVLLPLTTTPGGIIMPRDIAAGLPRTAKRTGPGGITTS